MHLHVVLEREVLHDKCLATEAPRSFLLAPGTYMRWTPLPRGHVGLLLLPQPNTQSAEYDFSKKHVFRHTTAIVHYIALHAIAKDHFRDPNPKLRVLQVSSTTRESAIDFQEHFE